MKKTLFVFFALCASLSGCFYDNYNELYPNAGSDSACDTADVTYSKQVSSVMKGYCISCHATGAASGNVVLDTYDGAMNSAASGKMVPSIRHENGHPAMPPNTQLDECSIRKVELWIENNYPL